MKEIKKNPPRRAAAPPTHAEITRSLRALGDPAVAAHCRRFFKTGKGEYGEGDRFLGIRVPVIRRQARRWRRAPLPVVKRLLRSGYHEERLLAVILLTERFKAGSAEERLAIFELYLAHAAWINNWDIVDVSAPHIVGPFLAGADGRRRVRRLAASEDLWQRRIAVIATFHEIRRGRFDFALEICRRLVGDPHDLIHKAVGWMLREIGKRDPAAEEGFLKAHCRRMPRTMLRYAIEKFPPERRRRYLEGEP